MISSMILAKMKEVAEVYLRQPVKDAIVTVPAYFNDSQRTATRDAGLIAGLNVLRIINEPTAAAHTYGLHKKNSLGSGLKNHKNVLVFDLGGGTFDVTLLDIKDGILDVKATNGDTHLGGEDFNDRMVNHFVAEFCTKYPRGNNIMGNPKALRRLRTECEKAKRVLSYSTTATIDLDALHNGIDFHSSMKMAKFEDLNIGLFQNCLHLVEQCLADAKMDKRDVGEVVLVGGSTWIPKVKVLLKEFFDGRLEPSCCVNPDEAVAYGAAVQAAMLGTTNDTAGDDKVIDMVLRDVTPLSLGLEVKGGFMDILIHRNTRVPTTRKKRFTTSHDGQTAVSFKVFEGERRMAKDNNMLGEFTLHGIPPAPEDVPKITVTFELDADGILHAVGQDKGTGRRAEITISNVSRLGAAEVERLVREAGRYRREDEEMKRKLDARNELERNANKVKNAVCDKHVADSISEAERSEVETAIGIVISWLEVTPELGVDECQRKNTELNNVWNPIIERVNNTKRIARLTL